MSGAAGESWAPAPGWWERWSPNRLAVRIAAVVRSHQSLGNDPGHGPRLLVEVIQYSTRIELPRGKSRHGRLMLPASRRLIAGVQPTGIAVPFVMGG